MKLSQGKRFSAGRPTLEATRDLSERILAVAEQHFLANGYVDTTFERIASDAKTSKGALYTRFEDKAKLFSHVCQRLIEKHYRSDIVSLDDRLPMRDSLRKQAIALVSAATDPRAVALYDLIATGKGIDPELATSTVAVWDFYVNQLEAYFQSRIDRHLLQLRNPRATATVFARMIFAPIHIAMVHGMNLPTAEEMAQHINDIVLVFLSGIGRLELEADQPLPEPTVEANKRRSRLKNS